MKEPVVKKEKKRKMYPTFFIYALSRLLVIAFMARGKEALTIRQ